MNFQIIIQAVIKSSGRLLQTRELTEENSNDTFCYYLYSIVNMYFKDDCYTSQLKCVFWLEENVSRAIGQNYLTP